ncbi:MAG: hypothetical protein LBV33_07885 [Lachnospiraceae bacterium]|nr:hypothetical protein [Lachnospiraceae bacterium]
MAITPDSGNIRIKRIIALLLIIGLFAINLQTQQLIGHPSHHTHDHHGMNGSCMSCIQADNTLNRLKQLSEVVISLLGAGIYLFCVIERLCMTEARILTGTPVFLKVRMNN